MFAESFRWIEREEEEEANLLKLFLFYFAEAREWNPPFEPNWKTFTVFIFTIEQSNLN